MWKIVKADSNDLFIADPNDNSIINGLGRRYLDINPEVFVDVSIHMDENSNIIDRQMAHRICADLNKRTALLHKNQNTPSVYYFVVEEGYQLKGKRRSSLICSEL